MPEGAKLEAEYTVLKQNKQMKPLLHIKMISTRPDGDEDWLIENALFVNKDQLETYYTTFANLEGAAIQKFKAENDGEKIPAGWKACLFVSH